MNQSVNTGICLIMKRQVTCLTVLAALYLVPTVLAAPGDASRLNPPVLTNGTAQITLTGESGVEYTLYSSSDLKNWTPLITNSDPQISRTFDFGPATNIGFFRATRPQLPVFSAALMATGTIDFNGWNFQADSFDSADPNHSYYGLYPADSPAQQKDNGHVMTDASVTNSSGLGTQKIKGRIRTGPDGLVTLGAGSSVGSKTWVEENNVGIQPAYGSNDMNVLMPPSRVPAGTYYYPPSGTIGGVSYAAILDTGNYWMNTIGAGSGNPKILVRGNAKLWTLGNFIELSGTNYIRIATNASLSLYASNGYAKFGEGSVINENNNATNFYYHGLFNLLSLKGNTNVTISSSFLGVVHAVCADLILGTDASVTNDFVGAAVSKSIKLNGPVNFHFDENLMRVGPTR